MNLDKVTRVEVIERGSGRLLVLRNAARVELSLQDDGKTLKVFVKEPKEDDIPHMG